MYWVWVSGYEAEDEPMVYGPDDFSDIGCFNFHSGKLAKPPQPLPEIVRGNQSQGKLPDSVLLRASGGLLFSPRLRQLLAGIGVDNIQYFPILLKNAVDGTQEADYEVANIVGRLTCLDRDESELVTDPDDDDIIEYIEKLAITENIVGNFGLFRLHEEPEVILVSEQIKVACESAEITGVRFCKPSEYEH
jgi:hypothetical protein